MYKNPKLLASALFRSLRPTKRLPTAHIPRIRCFSRPHPAIQTLASDRLLCSDVASPRMHFRSKSADGNTGRCWNCGENPPASTAVAPFLFCGSCGSVQPIDQSVDYFQIFGLERGFDIPDEDLKEKYKNWQKKLHPDLVHSKSEEERAYAAEQSAQVIDAYHTLGKPLSRALYLMKLEGVPVDEEKTVSDVELLAEMMEIREAVEDANDPVGLEQIQSTIQRKLETWSNSFKSAFKNRDFNNAVISIQRMTYYERALEETVKKL